MNIPFSILDLCAVPQGGDAGEALQNSALLARQAEALGFTRFWLAEHHNMPGIASAATAVVIGHVAAQDFDDSGGLRRVLCCLTMHHWSSPNNLGPLRHYIPDASISGLDGHRFRSGNRPCIASQS